MKFKITGIEAQAKKNFLTFSSLRPCGNVELRRDEANKYDKFCIEVLYNGVLLGYIPALKEGGVYVGSELQKHIIVKGIKTASVSGYSYIDHSGNWNTNHEGWLQSVELEIPTEEGGVDFCESGKYMRVTELIGYFNDGGKNDNLIKWAFSQGDTFEKYEAALQKTADAGTEMHEAIEQYFRWPVECKDMPYHDALREKLPKGFQAFIEKYQPRMVRMEERFYDDVLMVTGQPDFVGYVDGVLTVLDWKSSKRPSMKHKLQAAIYASNTKHEGENAVQAMVVCFGAENKQGYSVCKIGLVDIRKYYQAMKHLKEVINLCG